MSDSDDDVVIVIDEDDDESENQDPAPVADQFYHHGKWQNNQKQTNGDDSSSSSSGPPALASAARNDAHAAPTCFDVDESDSNVSDHVIDDARRNALDVEDDSSASSGIPSPWRATNKNINNTAFPPSVVHAATVKDVMGSTLSIDHSLESDSSIIGSEVCSAGSSGLSNQFKSTKRRCLKKNAPINENENSGNETAASAMHTTKKKATSKCNKQSKSLEKQQPEQSSSSNGPEPSENPSKQRKPKKRKNNSSKPTENSDIDSVSIPPSTRSNQSTIINNREGGTKHYHCYLLRSLDPNHPLKTYIGFTTNPHRRVRQHNGILKNGGANRTKKSGRPWTFVAVIHGFQDNITALQFEWAWQNVDKSKSFREAVECDKLAKKMRRRMGVKARLEELRILIRECLPFCLYSLTVYFPESDYRDAFCKLVEGARKKKLETGLEEEQGGSSCFEKDEEFLRNNVKVCSVEDMPFAKEAEELKEKKKNEKLLRKKTKGKKGLDHASEKVSEEKSSSDQTDKSDSEPSEHQNYYAQAMDLAFNDDSDDHFSFGLGSSDDESLGKCSSASVSSRHALPANNDLASIGMADKTSQIWDGDEISDALDFQSLSIDAHQTSDIDAKCENSIASSAASSHFSMENERSQKENRPKVDNRFVTKTISTNYDVYDLCDSS